MLPNHTSNMLADRIPTRTTTAWASNLSVGHWARHADKSVNSRDRTVTSRSGLVPRLATTPRTSSLRGTGAEREKYKQKGRRASHKKLWFQNDLQKVVLDDTWRHDGSVLASGGMPRRMGTAQAGIMLLEDRAHAHCLGVQGTG